MSKSDARMPFGKYRGEKLEDIPVEYLQWVLETCDLDSWLEQEMQAQIDLKSGRGVVRRTTP